MGIKQERGEGVEKGGQANQMKSQTRKQLTRGNRGDAGTQYQSNLRADNRGVSNARMRSLNKKWQRHVSCCE